MTSFLTIVRLTVLETVRDRVLWGYSIFALLLILGLFAVGKVPWGETHYIVSQLGYSAVALVSQVLVTLLGALQLGRDAERRVHYMILGRDIERSTYLLGKFVGLWITVILMVAVLMSIVFSLVTYDSLAYRPPMWSLLAAIPWVALQAGIMLAVAFLLYHATTSMTLAMVLALLALAIGRSAASIQQVLANFGDFAKTIGKLAAYLFPNLELMTFNDFVVYERAVSAKMIYGAATYGIAYLLAALALATFIFRRKEL